MLRDWVDDVVIVCSFASGYLPVERDRMLRCDSEGLETGVREVVLLTERAGEQRMGWSGVDVTTNFIHHNISSTAYPNPGNPLSLRMVPYLQVAPVLIDLHSHCPPA
jgi:hypothetical protein